MNHSVRYLCVLIFGAVAMACMGQAVLAQQAGGAQKQQVSQETQAAQEANAKALIDRLGVDSFDTREKATESLMLLNGLNDALVAAALRESTGEKRHRLVNIAMHHFYKRLGESHRLPIPGGLQRSGQAEAVGAIGIDTPDTNLIRADQHPGLEHAGWLITGTRPGFPGFVHLRSGDIITGLENQPFTDDLDQGYFIDMIQQYRFGETMALNVMRRDKRIVVKMVIGAKARLMFVAEQLAASGDQRPQMFGPWREHLGNLLGEKVFKPQIVIGVPGSLGAPENSDSKSK